MTIQKLSRLAGISTRTLRYYDEIGILKPARINSAKYRIYGQAEIDRLQQILFYKELGVELNDIKKMITSPSFDAIKTLYQHRDKLLNRRDQLEKLIANVEKTIAEKEGKDKMTNQEKFEGFKKKMLEENEAKYGEEIREKYGEETIKRSNEKYMKMTEADHKRVTKLAEDIQTTLAEAFATKDPGGELAQKAVMMHKEWLCFYWDKYSPEAHAGLGQMYVDDERFRAYYDKIAPGVAEFLRDAIDIYVKK